MRSELINYCYHHGQRGRQCQSMWNVSRWIHGLMKLYVRCQLNRLEFRRLRRIYSEIHHLTPERQPMPGSAQDPVAHWPKPWWSVK